MEITLSIVGTAGRLDDADKLSKKHFEAMYIVANGLIEQCKESNYPITHLVSGGAAWADHVAVQLFLDKKVEHLRLYLPCPFVSGSYQNNRNIHSSQTNDIAGTINKYHHNFQRKTGINSLTQILIAQSEGAELIPCKGGFHGRNAMVSKSDFILACTFGKDHMLKEGGTADTLRRYLKRIRKEGSFDKSFHYDLSSGNIFMGCQVPEKEESPEKILKKLNIPLKKIFKTNV